MPNPDFTKDAQERAQIIIPSELSPDELWQRNGEYVPIEFVRQAEQAAREKALDDAAFLAEVTCAGKGYHPAARASGLVTADAIRALKDQK